MIEEEPKPAVKRIQKEKFIIKKEPEENIEDIKQEKL
jgi:hypothetical protein